MHVHGYENFSEAVPVKVKGKKKMRKEEQTEEPEEKVEKQCPVEDFAVDPALSMDDRTEVGASSSGASPGDVLPVAAAADDLFMEKVIARSLKSYEFFEAQRQKRKASRLPRL